MENSPFHLSSFAWESQPGRYAVTVVAVATARLVQGGEATWLPEPEREPGHDEGQAAIARANLRAPFKPRVDVVVVGRAYPPPGTEADRLVVRLRIGDFVKALSVTGDRLWVRDAGRWGSSPPRPFTQMLLAQERALRSAENPAGIDPAAIPIEGRLALPNLEPVAGSYSAVIGPIPSSAPSRSNLLNQTGFAWVAGLESGRHAGPTPDGLHFGFFNIAPQDQQLVEIAKGTAIVLENLNPMHPMLASRLPSLTPRLIAVDPGSGLRIELATRLDTLWLDGDRETATLTFRATGQVSRPDLPVAVSVELEQPSMAPQPTLTNVSLLATQQGAAAQSPTGLPFGPPAASRPAGFPAWLPASEVATGPAGFGYAAATPPSAPRPVQNEPTQPHSRHEGSYPPPPPLNPTRSITAEILLQPPGHPTEGMAASAPLPFDAGAAFADSPGTPGEFVEPDSWGDDATDAPTPVPMRQPVRGTEPPPPLPGMEVSAGMPFVSSGPGPISNTFADPPTHVEAHPRALVAAGEPGPIPDIGPTLQPTHPDPPAAPSMPPPPPMAFEATSQTAAPILSEPWDAQTTSQGEADAISDTDPPPPLQAEPIPPPQIPPPPVPVPPPPVDRESLTLEECATVRAELSKPGADKTVVLARHRVPEALWPGIERGHMKALDEASQAGDTSQLDRYDDAYVTAQGRDRAPIDEATYARLTVAREKGTLAAALEQLGVSRVELMRIERVFRRKLSQNPEMADRVEDETERQRQLDA